MKGLEGKDLVPGDHRPFPFARRAAREAMIPDLKMDIPSIGWKVLGDKYPIGV
jgi:hypothetical protein